MENSKKYEMLSDLANKIYDLYRKEGYLNNYEIQHILFEAFDKYLLVNEQALRNKLQMVHVNDRYTEEVLQAERYEMSLNVAVNAMKDELKNNKELLEKYLLDYMKDVFCGSLTQEKDKEKFEDYVKYRKLLEERGLKDYKSTKEYFKRKDFEENCRTSEALDDYYSGRWQWR